jgi:hypothetical protein
MVEPVLVVDTGYSYEKAAITDWFNKGNKFCPRSGGLRGSVQLLGLHSAGLLHAAQRPGRQAVGVLPACLTD